MVYVCSLEISTWVTDRFENTYTWAMYAQGLYHPFSRGDTGIGKHNLLINVLLLTYAAINLCSAMLYMTVSQEEAGPKVME